jgi:hypothetical protein
MNKMSWAAALWGVGMALAPSAQAQYSIAAPHKGVSLQVWNQDLTGSLGGTDAGFTGTATISKSSDTSVGVDANLGKWELGYISLDQSTTASVIGTFKFDGQTYAAGDTLSLNHKVGMFDIFHRWTLASSDESTVHATFGFKVLDLKSEIRGVANPIQASLDETVPVPMVGLAGRFGPKNGVHGFGGFRIIDLGVSDVDVKLVDWSVGVAYQPTDRVRIAAGYRSFTMDIEITDLGDSGKIDLENKGLFFQAGIQF